MLQISDRMIKGTARTKFIKKYRLIHASLMDTEENRIEEAIKKRLNKVVKNGNMQTM